MEGVKPSGISRNESKLSEIKFSLNGINNGLGTTEEMIGNLDVRDAEIIQITTKEKDKKHKHSLRDLWDSIKKSRICV